MISREPLGWSILIGSGRVSLSSARSRRCLRWCGETASVVAVFGSDPNIDGVVQDQDVLRSMGFAARLAQAPRMAACDDS